MKGYKNFMPARNWAIRFLFGLIIFLLAACVESVGHERENTPTPRAPYETPTATPETPATVVPVSAVPPEVEQFAAEWPSANKDYQNSRATKDSTINAGNVSQLGLAWTFDIHGASKWGSAAGGILVANKTVYFQDLKSNVFALDLQSGAIKWQKLFQQSAFGPNGPALGWGKLFVQDGVNHIVALDLGSGNQLWSSPLYGPTGANQPMAFGGFVYTGVADGVYFQNPGKALELNKAGTSGYAFGLDQSNGKMIWSFQTVEEGFWGNPDVNSGAGVWFPPAIDTKTGMTYWSTGNPSPMPGIVGYPNAISRP